MDTSIAQIKAELKLTKDPIIRAGLAHELSMAIDRAARNDRARRTREALSIMAGSDRPWLATA